MPSKKKETKIITENWDKTDPRNIGSYLSFGGYGSLEKFVSEMDPELGIFEIEKSGLVGRGGAGFPTGQKMKMVADAPGKEKYLVCNLDESEPGNWKDRSIAEKNPHLLIEGIILGSLMIGAKEAFIYINGNFEKARELLEFAIEEARKKNFLGENILESRYSLRIKIFSGAGAYICGEETALISSMEGSRGEPRVRPPYPTEKGFRGRPTLVNNAETLSNLPWIIGNGGEKYARIGSKKSPGTKLFCLGGAVERPGIYEAPLGMSVRKFIKEYGGGVDQGSDLWFVQLGGASGRLLAKKDLFSKLEYDREACFPIGSGSILVVPKKADIKKLLLSWTDFFRRESCGKCLPCREGTFRLWEIMKRFRDGEISEADRSAVSGILEVLDSSTFCPLGKFAGTAVRDAIEKLKIFS